MKTSWINPLKPNRYNWSYVLFLVLRPNRHKKVNKYLINPLIPKAHYKASTETTKFSLYKLADFIFYFLTWDSWGWCKMSRGLGRWRRPRPSSLLGPQKKKFMSRLPSSRRDIKVVYCSVWIDIKNWIVKYLFNDMDNLKNILKVVYCSVWIDIKNWIEL